MCGRKTGIPSEPVLDILEPRPTNAGPPGSWILAPGSYTGYYPTAYCLLLPFPSAAREIRRITGGKRFLEGFVYFFFQVPILVVDFLVGSIRAHGIGSTKPHLFRLQESCATTG